MTRRRTQADKKKKARAAVSTSKGRPGTPPPSEKKSTPVEPRESHRPGGVQTGPGWSRYVWIVPMIQAFLLYLGIYDHGIVHWDDDLMLARAWQSPLSVDEFFRTLFHVRASYQPLRELSYAFDARVFDHDLWGFLLHNVLLYCLNVWVVFFIIQRLLTFDSSRYGGSTQDAVSPGNSAPAVPAPRLCAFLATALFVAHPLHVESVAWLAARKEVLSGLFFFLAFWLFTETHRTSGRRFWVIYAGSLIAYIFALLSKPSAASLPLLILAYDVVLMRPDRRAWKRRALLHAPYWIPALAAVLYFTLEAGTTETVLADQTIGVRLAALNLIVTHYFKTLILPIHLTARYAFDWKIPFISVPVLTGVALQLFLIAAFFFFLKRNRLLSFLVAWFYINLLPTSGIIPISVQAADRYMYIPSVAFCVFVVWLVFRLSGKLLRRSSKVATATAVGTIAAVILVFSFLSVKQAEIWENDLTLWGHTARYNPSDLSYYALGEAYRRRGDNSNAEHFYRLSAQANPAFVRAWNGLGNMLLLRKDVRGAEAAYLKALEADPNYDHAHRHLAIVYVSLRDYDRALYHAEKAYELSGKPDPVLTDMLCRLYMKANEWEKLEQTAKYLFTHSDDRATALIYLFRAYQGMGELALARESRSEAYRENPEKARQAERTTIFRE